MNEPRKQVIERIKHLDKINGYLTPDIIVKDARDPKSPLHGEFNWDVNEAAHSYWLHQARQLIKSVKVIIQTDSRVIKTVAYVRDPEKSGNEQGYISVASVRNDKEKAREVLVDEFKRAGSALQRAQRLAIAFNIENEVEAMAEKVNKLREDVEEYSLSS